MSNYNATGSGYLETTVRSASPARLRLMLLERAVDTASRLKATWESGESPGSNEHSLKLLDLINELLSGITGGDTDSEKELCGRIADLYVFLAKHLVAAEQISDYGSIGEIKLVLEAEAETWRAVCAQETGAVTNKSTLPPASGLNIQG